MRLEFLTGLEDFLVFRRKAPLARIIILTLLVILVILIIVTIIKVLWAGLTLIGGLVA